MSSEVDLSDERPGEVILAPGRPRRRFPWLRRRLTLEPYQVGIVIRDGRVAEVFSEGARRLPRGEVRTHVASTAPFNLVFWLKDPGDPSEPGEGVALDQPVLTSDSQLVTGRIDLTLSVVPDDAERLLQLPRPSGVITPADVGDAIRAELLAKVLALDIHRHTAGELRGNREIFSGIGASLETELASTIERYGLNLDNFYPSWGLTHEEREEIEEQRHRSAIRDIERRKELEKARRDEPDDQPDAVPRLPPPETGPPAPPRLPPPTEPPPRREWVPLSELAPQTFDAAPMEVSFPNGERAALTAWTSVQRETVRWLARQGMLKGPVPGGQPGKLLVNKTPFHADGSPFPEAAEIDGWYTPMGMDGRDVVGRTVRIIEHVGQHPGRFQVRFAGDDRPPADAGGAGPAERAGPGAARQQPAKRRGRRAPKIAAAVVLVGALLVAAAVMRPRLGEIFDPPNTPTAATAAMLPPTSTPITGPVPASNIPFPTRTLRPTATAAPPPARTEQHVTATATVTFDDAMNRILGRTPTPTPTNTAIPRPTATPTPTYTPTPTPTNTATPRPTATPTPTYTPTPTPTNTATPTPTNTPAPFSVALRPGYNMISLPCTPRRHGHQCGHRDRPPDQPSAHVRPCPRRLAVV